jgi:hypothetical protein
LIIGKNSALSYLSISISADVGCGRWLQSAWLQATGGGATPPPQEGATAHGGGRACGGALGAGAAEPALRAGGVRPLALKLLGVLPRLGGPPRAQGNELHCILGRQPGDAVIMAARGCPEARVSHNARRGRAHNCGQRQVGARDCEVRCARSSAQCRVYAFAMADMWAQVRERALSVHLSVYGPYG